MMMVFIEALPIPFLKGFRDYLNAVMKWRDEPSELSMEV